MIAIETLSHRDLLALNRAIGEVYAAQDIESFHRSVFSSVQTIIPGELCSFNDTILNPTPRFLTTIAASPEHNDIAGKLRPALNAHLHEHPLSPQFCSPRFDRVVKTTDFAAGKRFKGSAIHHEYYRHLDVDTQIIFSIPIYQEKVSLFALSRRCPDYSERDRLILTLLRPHLINALRNATEFDRMRLEKDLLQKGAEAERQGAVLVRSDGTVLCISPVAKELLKKHFGANLNEGAALPGGILKWFKATRRTTSVERAPLTLEKDDRCLAIKLLNDFTTGDYILVVRESDLSSAMQELQGYGLSRRETEVLTWLSKGKTNPEIAMILGISRRTAEKHLENIFAKLGVETRAAAVAIMR